MMVRLVSWRHLQVINSYPQYTVHWKTGQGELSLNFSFQTPIRSTGSEGHDFIRLTNGGILELRKGYVWDFGSGPAIDTPDMVYASLAHDAFYELMDLKMLPWSYRKQVDQYFEKLLKEAGMGWLRRRWVYMGVRIGYPIWKALGR